MTYSTRERISHVVRRLGIGANPDRVHRHADTEEAIAGMLDLGAAPATPPDIAPPLDMEEARRRRDLAPAMEFWLRQMVSSPRPLEERLVWFWHDHFATDIRKVQISYLMWRQHLTLRRHATGSFADLLRAVAKDPAMLIYLDGITSSREAVNENFGREVMELFTIGRGHYGEADVKDAARAFTGWVVNIPGHRHTSDRVPLWDAVFVPFRHDPGTKTLLGVTGHLDLDDAVDVLLEHPATAETIAAKLWAELVGTPLPPDRRRALGDLFRRDYQIFSLVTAIASDPAFTADAAVRARVRTPLEKAIGVLQGFASAEGAGRYFFDALTTVGYAPFLPPNVAGFPDGIRLLGPHTLIHAFDLVAAVDPTALPEDTDEAFARLGLHDVASGSRAVVSAAATPARRFALAVASPEYALT